MSSAGGFINVSVQKFASEGDLALFERNWSEHKDLVLQKLGAKGMIGFTSQKVWNQDEDLTRMYIFKYESPEAVKACLPVWKELESILFAGIAMKVTAYRGVTLESWTRD